MVPCRVGLEMGLGHQLARLDRVRHGAEARVVAQLRWAIPKMYKHHKHASKDVDVDFWRCTPPPARTPTTDAEASEAAEDVERLQVARG